MDSEAHNTLNIKRLVVIRFNGQNFKNKRILVLARCLTKQWARGRHGGQAFVLS